MTGPRSTETAGGAAKCDAWCDLAGTAVECHLERDHRYEHEASEQIAVWAEEDIATETAFLVWWGDDGHAFVGSKDAVSTGRIG